MSARVVAAIVVGQQLGALVQCDLAGLRISAGALRVDGPLQRRRPATAVNLARHYAGPHLRARLARREGVMLALPARVLFFQAWAAQQVGNTSVFVAVDGHGCEQVRPICRQRLPSTQAKSHAVR